MASTINTFGSKMGFSKTSVKHLASPSLCVHKLTEILGKSKLAISVKASLMPLSLTVSVSAEAAACGRDSLLPRFTSVPSSSGLTQPYEEKNAKHCSETCLQTLWFLQDPGPAPKLLGAVLSYLVRGAYITHIRGHSVSPPFGYTLRFS